MRPSRLELINPPEAEPVTRELVKQDIHVTESSEDSLIDAYITEAREACEAITHRRLIQQTWKLYFDGFVPLTGTDRQLGFASTGLVLSDVTPVQAVLSVQYVDAQGVLTTLAADQFQLLKRAPAKIIPAFGVTWPSVRAQPESVIVTLQCGYGSDGDAVPASIKSWIRAAVGARFNYRESQSDRPPTEVGFIRSLLDCYVVEDL